LAAARASENQALTDAFSAFESLTPGMRQALLNSIEIVDRAPLLTELETALEESLRLIAPRGKAPAARELLEGWWWPRICRALQEGGGKISILELEAKLDDIRDAMRRDTLPTDMEHADPTHAELDALSEMMFVQQLRSVGVGNNRIQFAKRDYYRAFTQRSQWTRQNLLFDGEVSKFERTLVEEWQHRFETMRDGLDGTAGDVAIRHAGQGLYTWAESEARFPFRTISARFLNVCSYHILANDLKVGWHRDYSTIFRPEDGGLMPSKMSWDLRWSDRPSEEARNLNPAFCGEILFRTVSEYFKLRRTPFSFPLSFVVLPLVLHKPTRNMLPGRASTAFAGWIAECSPFLAEFPDRVVQLVPITRKPIGRTALPSQVTDDVAEARSAAALLGRWFGSQGSPSTIMQGFGVSP
jgi:hypothetical protein